MVCPEHSLPALLAGGVPVHREPSRVMSTLQRTLQSTRTCPASVRGGHSTDYLAYSLEHSRAYSLKVREAQVRGAIADST